MFLSYQNTFLQHASTGATVGCLIVLGLTICGPHMISADIAISFPCQINNLNWQRQWQLSVRIVGSVLTSAQCMQAIIECMHSIKKVNLNCRVEVQSVYLNYLFYLQIFSNKSRLTEEFNTFTTTTCIKNTASKVMKNMHCHVLRIAISVSYNVSVLRYMSNVRYVTFVAENII